MEWLCLSKAMQHGDVEWETGIVAAAHRIERLQETRSEAEARKTLAWNQAHGAFHEALVAACPSAWLLRTRAVLYAQSEHKRLMEAVLRRDEPAALQALEAYFFATVQIILRSPLLQ